MIKLPENRESARIVGSTRYFTGKPCVNGHVADRATSSGSCVACMQVSKVAWRKKVGGAKLASYTRHYRLKSLGKVGEDDRRCTLTNEVVQAKLASLPGGKLTLLSPEVRSGHPLEVICEFHGPIKVWYNNVLRGKGCAACATDATRMSQEEFVSRAKSIHGDRWGYDSAVYKTSLAKVAIRCQTHGLYEQTPNKHLMGQGCPSCGLSDPKWERDMDNFLQGLCQKTRRNAAVLGTKHIDVYVESHKFGIELHGLHWHTTEFRERLYHRKKWETAKKLGIRLVQIFEDEWRDKRPQIENRIRALLGKCETYDARKTNLVQLTSKDATKFLNDHHTQGAGRAKLYYGLRFNNELVAVASFGPSRSGAMTDAEGDDWEVIRYASKGRVRGGFSKLFAQFKKDVQPSQVVSYCDLRFGDGKLYEACGFSLDKITEPDYWWVPVGGLVRIPRYQTQKHKLENHPVLRNYYAKGLTEKQICESAGWQKIYGVGHQRWVYAA